jgi:hypothetical protein
VNLAFGPGSPVIRPNVAQSVARLTQTVIESEFAID